MKTVSGKIISIYPLTNMLEIAGSDGKTYYFKPATKLAAKRVASFKVGDVFTYQGFL